MADQQQAADEEIAGMRRIGRIAMAGKGPRRRLERLDRKGKVARGKSDLGLGDEATRAGHRLARAEGAGRPFQKTLGALEIAELRHGDAAKRQCRRILAQRHALKRTQRIAGGKRPAGRVDQRVHANPVTIVTPTPRPPAPIHCMSRQ